ncbi:MAG: hypothetical protein H8E62_02505 [Planctomycetes bacterium]|nr:hypothetical protein [Planctomycetota bacterium]
MRHIHLHTPDWTHGPQWHTIQLHLQHLIHDPRFWAGVALAVLVGAMLLTLIQSKSGRVPDTGPLYPSNPFLP